MDYTLVLNHILIFLLSLYGNESLPRKIVDEVIRFFNNFLQDIYIPELKNDIISILKRYKVEESCLKDVQQCLDTHSKIYEYVKTESSRFDLLKRKDFFNYSIFPIGVKYVKKIINNKSTLVHETMTGVFIPLSRSLKLFLEIPNLFNKIFEHSKQLSKETRIITNIIQGSLWLDKYAKKFVNDIVFPLYLFYDDLEVGNVLGSHAGTNKFGAVYVTITNLPPYIASRLQSMLFYSLIHTEDKKK